MEREIHSFLLTTAQWTTRWFNKAKFHIILRLPDHIRRFGPAVLFATEAFESFNTVIHAKSVHSNCQAPSRDIALAFAQGNHIRHLLSGGFFLKAIREPTTNPDDPEILRRPSPFLSKVSDWKCIGPGPLHLLEIDNTLPTYLGIPPPNISSEAGKLAAYRSNFVFYSGLCKRDKTSPRLFSQTMTGVKLPHIIATSNAHYETSTHVYLLNGDKCSVGQYVIVCKDGPNSHLFIACVCEILQQVHSVNYQEGRPDGILVQTANSTNISQKFQMPELALQDIFSFVPIVISNFFFLPYLMSTQKIDRIFYVL